MAEINAAIATAALIISSTISLADSLFDFLLILSSPFFHCLYYSILLAVCQYFFQNFFKIFSACAITCTGYIRQRGFKNGLQVREMGTTTQKNIASRRVYVPELQEIR